MTNALLKRAKTTTITITLELKTTITCTSADCDRAKNQAVKLLNINLALLPIVRWALYGLRLTRGVAPGANLSLAWSTRVVRM